MTALKEYARLESTGLWRPDPQAQRREVGISFGDATLVISDNAGRPLAHWSLAAVNRENPGTVPALFTPDPDAREDLEIADETMIDAIEKVRRAIARARPRPGRLRALGVITAVAGLAALGVFWLPGALMDQADRVVPAVKRTEIGGVLLGHVQRLTGQTCRGRLGSQALAALHEKVIGSDGTAVVVPSGPATPLYLPGGIIVLTRAMVEDTEDPAVVAGHMLAAAAQGDAKTPLRQLLEQAGLGATVRLLTTGDVPPDQLRAYAEALVAAPPGRAPDTTLLRRFEAAQIPSTPYGYAIDVTGESTLGLIEADPMAGKETPPLMSDGDWISLQGICS